MGFQPVFLRHFRPQIPELTGRMPVTAGKMPALPNAKDEHGSQSRGYNYFCLTKSERFRSRSLCGITLTSGKSFFSGSMNAGAFPTMIKLGADDRYFVTNAVTSSVLTALIFGMNAFNRSSGRP